MFPVLPLEYAGIAATAITKVGLIMAGIGGAGVIVAIAMAFFGFDTKRSVAISSFATFAATFGSFIFNFREKHPEKPKVVVVDYGVSCLMMPTTLAGA